MTGRRRRGNPEAEIQRAIVAALRVALPPGAIVHHSGHEQRGGDARAKLAQAIGVGMGVHPGFADLVVVAAGRVAFLEVKTAKGQLSDDQKAFRDTIRAQGLPYAVVRSINDALFALTSHGFKTRASAVWP
jgi:hypothetical protein